MVIFLIILLYTHSHNSQVLTTTPQGLLKLLAVNNINIVDYTHPTNY